jgi:hypothetical protein
MVAPGKSAADATRGYLKKNTHPSPAPPGEHSEYLGIQPHEVH